MIRINDRSPHLGYAFAMMARWFGSSNFTGFEGRRYSHISKWHTCVVICRTPICADSAEYGGTKRPMCSSKTKYTYESVRIMEVFLYHFDAPL
jgi:hypothetical protein